MVHLLQPQNNLPVVLDTRRLCTFFFFFMFIVYCGFCCEIVIWLFINQEQKSWLANGLFGNKIFKGRLNFYIRDACIKMVTHQLGVCRFREGSIDSGLRCWWEASVTENNDMVNWPTLIKLGCFTDTFLVNMGSRKTMLSFQFYPLSPDITLGSRILGKAGAHSAPDIKSLFTGLTAIYLGYPNLFRLKAFRITKEIDRHCLSWPNSSTNEKAKCLLLEQMLQSKCVKLVKFCFLFLQPR